VDNHRGKLRQSRELINSRANDFAFPLFFSFPGVDVDLLLDISILIGYPAPS